MACEKIKVPEKTRLVPSPGRPEVVWSWWGLALPFLRRAGHWLGTNSQKSHQTYSSPQAESKKNIPHLLKPSSGKTSGQIWPLYPLGRRTVVVLKLACVWTYPDGPVEVSRGGQSGAQRRAAGVLLESEPRRPHRDTRQSVQLKAEDSANAQDNANGTEYSQT